MKRIFEKAVELAAGFGVRRAAATLTLSAAGLASIASHEDVVHRVYLDPAGIPTACMGHTGNLPAVGTPVSDATCDRLAREDTSSAVRDVQALVKVPVSQAQFDALVDFDFNTGRHNLATSTLLRKLNAGDCHGAAAEFPRWNKARGKVLTGLVNRRADERAKFEPDCP